jgi:ribosomal protein L37E
MHKLSRRTLLSRLPLLGLAAVTFHAAQALATHHPARLCNNCGFGSKKDDCAKCGKWMGSTKIPARLCDDHGFGSKKDNCVKCGRWAP